jgi:ketosteroid isomerase-like protein
MSQENVEVVRRALDAFCERDLEQVTRYWDPEIEIDWSRSPGVEAGVYRGLEPARGFVSTFLETFDRIVIVPYDVVAYGDHVVVPHRVRLSGRDGITVEARGVLVHTLRDGRVIGLTMYRERDEALKAVGLALDGTAAGSPPGTARTRRGAERGP